MLYRFVCLFTASMLLFLTSCGREDGMMSRLEHLDEMIDSQPDSACGLIKELNEERGMMTAEALAYYDLLTVKADAQTESLHTTDSIINRVIEYYEQHNDRHKLVKAYYYAGCFHLDKGSSVRKSLYYNELALLCDTANLDDYWRSRIFAQKGKAYMRAKLYEEAQVSIESSHTFCLQTKDSIGARYCREKLDTIARLLQMERHERAEVQFANRQVLNLILERAHTRILRLDRQRQEAGMSGRDVNLWMVTAVILSICFGVGVFVYRSRRSELQSNMQRDEEPKKRPFFDAEIDLLLKRRLKDDKVLKPSDWTLIEERLLQSFPEFRNKLYSLYELSETEYRICLLIKMQTSPSHIARLLSMGNSSVSQCRLRMQQKVFNGKGTAKDWDNFVHSM